jgi:cell division protein FtsB
LATTRAQKSALEQQVKTLKDLNVKFGNEAQAARDELDRIQYGRDKERGSAEGRTKELEERVKQLAAQNRSLRLEYEDTKRHNETLKSLVARYQKELKVPFCRRKSGPNHASASRWFWCAGPVRCRSGRWNYECEPGFLERNGAPVGAAEGRGRPNRQ